MQKIKTIVITKILLLIIYIHIYVYNSKAKIIQGEMRKYNLNYMFFIVFIRFVALNCTLLMTNVIFFLQWVQKLMKYKY